MLKTIVFVIIVLSLVKWTNQVKGWDKIGRGILAVIAGILGAGVASALLVAFAR
jgi:hypothetical protein